MKIKPTLRNHYEPTRIANVKDWQYQVLVMMQSNWNPHALLMGMLDGTATLSSLTANYNIKHNL